MNGIRKTDSRPDTLSFVNLDTIPIKEMYQNGVNGVHDELSGCFIGIGSLGSDLAKQIKRIYNIQIEMLSIYSSGEPAADRSFLTDNLNLNIKDKLWDLVILAGSIEDPSFISAREIVLSYNPDFLWTIAQTPKGNLIQGDSFVPASTETISIIKHADGSFDKIYQLIIVIYYACYQVNSIMGFDMADFKSQFSGRFTSIVCFRSNANHHEVEFSRFIDQNKKLFLNATNIHVGLIYKNTSFTLQEVTDYIGVIQSQNPKESQLSVTLNVANELRSFLCSTLITTG
jgi:hypothetical protein